MPNMNQKLLKALEAKDKEISIQDDVINMASTLYNGLLLDFCFEKFGNIFCKESGDFIEDKREKYNKQIQIIRDLSSKKKDVSEL